MDKDYPKNKEPDFFQNENIITSEIQNLIFENANVLITIIQNGKIRYANKLTINKFGYSEEELQKNDFINFIHPEDKSLVYNNYVNRLKGIETDSYDFRIQRKDKTFLWVRIRSERIKLKNGYGALSFFSDINKEKQAEQDKMEYAKNMAFLSESALTLLNLKKEKEIYTYLIKYLTKLIDAKLYVVSFIDINARSIVPHIIDGNDDLRNMISEFLKKDFDKINLEISDFAIDELSNGYLTQVPGGFFEFAFGAIPKEICNKIEEKYNLGNIFSIGLNRNDNLFGCISFVLEKNQTIKNKEIIETFIMQAAISLYHMRIEKELIVAKEKAETSDNLKSAFIANVSHEIRTPLHAISGFSKILNTKNISEEKKYQFLQYIQTNCDILQNLINDIISISQLEAQQMSIFKQECVINDILNDVYYTFNEELNRKHDKNVELKLDIQDEIRKLIIFSDSLRIRQVLNNLLSNAIKFTSEGYIKFGCRIEDNNKLLFYIKDTGIGIPEDKKELIFNRFQRINNSKKEFYSGTGLGLSISKSLVELLGGKIWFESEEGKGSTFYFYIPIEKRGYYKGGSIDKHRENASFDWTGKTILIAEDEDFNYLVLKEVIGDTNAELIRAKNGKEVVDICMSEQKIDLILLDIQMPVMNGYEACSKVIEKFPDMTIIAQTAYAMEDEKQKLLHAGCLDFITKPIDIDKMMLKLNKYLFEKL